MDKFVVAVPVPTINNSMHSFISSTSIIQRTGIPTTALRVLTKDQVINSPVRKVRDTR